ncbi:hypothetical protein ADIS_1721 [Lunatimonas lonarensis]|uniref:Uncharacterized protein n=1 Tax=Lunatimonas lonarensis TaxID=1232681 RepID=R7ZUP3_9BACT|nr:hypothetical protein ADIS_1721 [Lunatimonas lonarensis]
MSNKYPPFGTLFVQDLVMLHNHYGHEKYDPAGVVVFLYQIQAINM